ncbi:major facilitator superfamily-like protein [Aureococcus anophagefferens]|nr:major facilitator superfamily-like protein [Aureococcus anophagefferens]
MAPSSNWNVRCTLAFYPALTICTSLATSAPLAAYILLRTGSNVKVGLAVGAQGVANLLAAFPAAWLGTAGRGRWSSASPGAAGRHVGAGASVLSPGLERHARVQYGAICGALLILGLFMGGHSSSVLGNAAGPLVSIAVFASLGDEWRKGELEVVIARGCCFVLPPRRSLGEAHTLGGSLSESLLSGGGRESESAPRKTDRATEVGDGPTVVVLYCCATWLMNCCMGLTRSVLNDYVRKAERARWNAAESINLFSWSGSAALGGYLIDRHGYRVTFLVTAAIQFVAALILASIALLVRSERSHAATPPDDDG